MHLLRMININKIIEIRAGFRSLIPVWLFEADWNGTEPNIGLVKNLYVIVSVCLIFNT